MRYGARILSDGTILPPPADSSRSILPPVPRDAPDSERIVQQSKPTTAPPRGLR